MKCHCCRQEVGNKVVNDSICHTCWKYLGPILDQRNKALALTHRAIKDINYHTGYAESSLKHLTKDQLQMQAQEIERNRGEVIASINDRFYSDLY